MVSKMASCAGRLRNIEFTSIQVRILSIEHISRVLIEWELKPTNQRIQSLQFFVQRSESTEEWETVSGPIAYDALPEFIDYGVNLFDLQKVYHYRVVAKEMMNGVAVQEFYSDKASTSGNLDLSALFVVEENLFLHRYVQGIPTFIYKRRKDGGRCPECWDSVLKRVTKSNCQTCYGTGKLEGYYDPIEGWMTFSPRVEGAQVQQQGVAQPERGQAEFTDYPEITVGDIVLDIRGHMFWRVIAVQSPEKNRVGMLQTLQMSIINRSDIEYSLEYPEDRARALVAELETRIAEVEF